MRRLKVVFRLVGLSIFVIFAVTFCLNMAFAAEKDAIQEESKIGKSSKKSAEPREIFQKDTKEGGSYQDPMVSEGSRSERGFFDRVRDFFRGPEDRGAEAEDRETIRRQFRDETGREMTIDEEKEMFNRRDDGEYHGSIHDHMLEIAGREHERAAREYGRENTGQNYERDSSKEIDYNREAAEREREANSRELEYGREIPERDSSRETDYDREAAEREREANSMERY